MEVDTQNIVDKEVTPVIKKKTNISKTVRSLEHIGKKIKIIPLGGLEIIGMNITAIEYNDSIIVIDCGMAFPDEKMPGVDLIIPNVEYLKKNIEKVKGFFITHGHEDHIGAIPYVLKEINVPIYATKLTMGLISHKLEEHKMLTKVKKRVVKFGQTISTGDIKVEFIKTNHSIQDSAALAIHTPVGTVVHTGDFKVDYTPVFGDQIDLARFAELGRRGILAMMCDSTNAARNGFTPSEKVVGERLASLFDKYQENRILVASFASNVDRVQQIINIAHQHDRKVVVDGRSMVNIIEIATELGYIRIPEDTLISADELPFLEDKKVVIVTTGSQGEQMASLSRIAKHKHTRIAPTKNDVVIFSSHPIPGNEKAVNAVVNTLMECGAKVIMNDVHASGHACSEDIKLIYSLVKPLYGIPIHGEYQHRLAQSEILRELGYDDEHIMMLSSGDVLELNEEKAEIVDRVEYGKIMVDGNGIGNVGNIVIKERQQLSQDGIVMIVMTMKNGNIVSGPDIICRGFVYMRESQDLINHMYKTLDNTLQYCKKKNMKSWSDIKDNIKSDMGDFLWLKMKARPMILPVIMEV